MKVELNKLKEGENILSKQESSSVLDLPDKHFSVPVEIKGTVDKRGKNYYFKITAETDGEFQCDRCLKQFNKSFHVELSFVFSKENYFQDSEDQDDFHVVSEDTNEVDISHDIRDAILLEIPIRVLCSENCKGICSGCGAYLNEEKCTCEKDEIDPRWEMLKNIKFDNRKE